MKCSVMIKRKICFTLCIPRGFYETLLMDFFFFVGNIDLTGAAPKGVLV